MDMGKEVYAQKTDFIRLFWEKVVSDVSRWAWHTREQVINRKKPIFLKLALQNTDGLMSGKSSGPLNSRGPEPCRRNFAFSVCMFPAYTALLISVSLDLTFEVNHV